MEDLDMRRIRDYFERIRGQAMPGVDDIEGWQKLLINTEFLVRQDARTPATIAALLLFSQNPNKFLAQAGIDAAAYPGKEKDYAAKERLAIRGPLTPLFSYKNLLENGLVEQAVEFVRRNTGVSARLADGARREEFRAYPEEAVREAIVNALVHRDYLLSGTDIELSIYEDRLEVISPGKLPNLITDHAGTNDRRLPGVQEPAY
jgi:ATP-dependent DNA helicase RecG